MALEKETLKTLGNLAPAGGSHRSKKRLGRGMGSGLGKTAGKGHKGQLQRTGGSVRPGFEGGQMPLYRRLPKRGFVQVDRTIYQAVNLSQLNLFDANAKVTPALLQSAGIIKDATEKVKLLGRGTLEKKGLTVTIHAASQAARAVLEKAGGKVEEIKG